MPNIIHVVWNHPLHSSHCFHEGLTLGNVRISSIKQGFNYLKLLHHGKEPAARQVLSDVSMTWNPDSAAQLVHRNTEEPNVGFVAHTADVLRAIMRAQMKPGNPFCEALEQELQQVDDPSEAEFRVYTSSEEMLFTSGQRYGQWKENIPGFDIYAHLLGEMTHYVMNGREPPSNELLQEIMSNPDLFRSSESRSVLVVADSECRVVKKVVGGEVIPLSGGRYGHMVNALRSFNLADFKWIVVFCGMNCTRPSYSTSDRQTEWQKLKETLVDEANRRDTRSVMFCFSFDHPSNPDNGRHARYVRRELENTRVEIVTWENDNPFMLPNGHINMELFHRNPKKQVRSDEIHVNKHGFRILWKKWCEYFPELKYFTYTLRDKPKSVSKFAFPQVDSPPRSRAVAPDLRVTVNAPGYVPSQVSRPSEPSCSHWNANGDERHDHGRKRRRYDRR